MIPIVIPRVDTEKKPDHVGEGLLQGLNKFGDHVGDGAKTLWRKPQEGHQKEGALGAAKGVGEGLLSLTTGIGKGACDLLGSTLEGVRHTPDAVADKFNKDRQHAKHGVEGDGTGEILETYVDEKEPEHLGHGLLSGARGFGKGLFGGLQDLANKPVEGAREGGVAGFARGAGQGLLGFGTKTASGTLDLATSVLSGAKNTPDAIGRTVTDLRNQQAEDTNERRGSRLFGADSASSSFGFGEKKPEIPTFGGQGYVLGDGASPVSEGCTSGTTRS